jgi:ABC-type nickel/cobalt efflux system permease component RcnA
MVRQRIVRALWLFIAVALASSAPVAAHPLGNFSISQYTGVQIEPDAIVLRYFVDMAEIPTFQEMQSREIPADSADPRVARYVRETADSLKTGLVLEVDGRRLALDVRSADVIFPPGAADLPTMKLAMRLTAALPIARGAAEDLRYHDDNFASRAGWKEIIAIARSGSAVVESSVPDHDRSRELSDYPTDLLDSPPQVREARVRFSRPLPPPTVARVSTPRSSPEDPSPSTTGSVSPAPSDGAAPDAVADSATTSVAMRAEAAVEAPFVAKANVGAVSRNAFTNLITTRELTLSVVAVALVVAAALGAFHALEPGHGKTVVAAYLVGSRGTARHALILGLIVTASHTAGVYLLGAVTFYASHYVVPERLYPWVALVSGLTIAGLGLSLFLRHYAGAAPAHHHHHHGDHRHAGHHHHGELAHTHAGEPGHTHEPAHEYPHDHPHTHGPGIAGRHWHHHESGHVSLRQLWALGITGGIVPCPAALVVLLSALSLRRVGFGLLLIVAFSIGLAAVLIAIGVLMVYARRLMARFDESGPVVMRWLPLTSSAVMTLLGVSIAVQALASGALVWKLT